MKRKWPVMAKVKPFLKPVLFCFVVYTVAMLSIYAIGGNFHDDDIRRAYTGITWLEDFGRYGTSVLTSVLTGSFFNFQNGLTDIFPLPQILATLLWSINSVILVKVLCGKIKYLPLLVSTLFGLCPFMVDVLSRNFDSFPITLAVTACLVPFLFYDKVERARLKYFWITAGCLLLAWITYQATVSVFIVMIFVMAFDGFIKRAKLKAVVRKTALLMGAFLTAGVIYGVVFGRVAFSGYRETSLLGFGELLSGVFSNIGSYLATLKDSLNVEWGIAVVLMGVCFIASLIAFSKRRNKAIDGLGGVVFLVVAVILSAGILVFIHNPRWAPRSLFGIGLVLAAVGVMTARNQPKKCKNLLATPSVMAVGLFAVFFLAFGNAVRNQAEYADFRAGILENDLSRIDDEKWDKDDLLYIDNSIGASGMMKQLRERYPIINIMRLQSFSNGLDQMSTRRLVERYSRETLMERYYYDELDFDCLPEQMVADTRYHTIMPSSIDGLYCVFFNE
jgi:uncharacterized membrane protein YfcA